jgi:hypothetical protein
MEPVEKNVLSILAKSISEFNGQVEKWEEKNDEDKKGEKRRNQKISNVEKAKPEEIAYISL